MRDRTSRLLIGRRAGVIGFTVAGVVAAMVSVPFSASASSAKPEPKSRPAPTWQLAPKSNGPVTTTHSVRKALPAMTPLATVTVKRTFTVNDLGDTHDASPGDRTCTDSGDKCTLRAAIEQADSLLGVTAINVPVGTITLSLGELLPTASMIITGMGSGTDEATATIVDGNAASRVFYVSSGSTELANMTVANGAATADSYSNSGGGIYLGNAKLTLTSVLVTGNTAGTSPPSYTYGYGGGVYVGANGSLWLADSHVEHNTATYMGGGIYIDYGSVNLTNSTIGGLVAGEGNSAGTPDYQGGHGGGIASYGTLVADNVTIAGNSATYRGGGFWNDGSATVTGGTITANSADAQTSDWGYGGGVFNEWALSMSGTTVSNNIARGVGAQGGGIANEQSASLTDVTVTGNAAYSTQNWYYLYGGGIDNDATLQMSGGSITYNTAGLDSSLEPSTDSANVYGAGLYNSATMDTMSGVSITHNDAVAGQGYVYGAGVSSERMSIANSTVSDNTASGYGIYGTGVYNNGVLSMSNMLIDRNAATAYYYVDGAAVDSEGQADLSNVSMDANVARANGTDGYLEGGAVYLYGRATFDTVWITNTVSEATDANGYLYGGALYASYDGALTANRLNVLGTSAVAGVGLYGASVSINYANGQTSITNSAVASNTGDVTGAAGYAEGGGVYQYYPTDYVNVTIGGNSVTASGGGTARYGGAYINSDAQMTNVTLASNTAATDVGGLYVDSGNTLAVTNTIVAANTSAGVGNCAATGTITSGGYNLEDADTCGFTATGDQVNADPHLGAPADNGGDVITMALPLGSPAVDAGTADGAPTTDARGIPRPQGAGYDVGAFELAAPGTVAEITSPDHATFSLGVPGTFTVTANGTPPLTLSKTGDLPAGVSFTDNGDGTATIAGTPGSGTVGDWPITITAANSVGPDATQSFNLFVESPLAISGSLTGMTVGQPYSATLQVTGGTSPYTWSVMAGKLPKGLKLSSSTGTIFGTPKASGSFSFTILVYDSSMITGTATYAVTVAPRTH